MLHGAGIFINIYPQNHPVWSRMVTQSQELAAGHCAIAGGVDLGQHALGWYGAMFGMV